MQNNSNITSLQSLLLILGISVLSACSTEPKRTATTGEVSLVSSTKLPTSAYLSERLLIYSNQIHDITYRLKVGNRKLCGALVTHEVGLSYLSATMLKQIGLESSAFQIGENGRLTIYHVVPGSAADRAGVKADDSIERISSTEVADDAQKEDLLETNLNRVLKSGKPFALDLRRGPDQIHTMIEPEVTCDFQVELRWFDGGYSGDGIHVTVRRERDVRRVDIWLSGLEGDPNLDLDENTLALYIAHQAAHELIEHPERLDKAATAASIADTPFFIGSMGLAIASMGAFAKPVMPFTAAVENQRGEEPKADLLSLYMLAAAGYDPKLPASALRKLVAAKGYKGISSNLDVDLDFWNNTSELTKKRLIKMETEVAKIEERQRDGIPLITDVPELEAIIREISDVRAPEEKATAK